MAEIEYTKEGRVAILRINRPETMGILDVKGMQALTDALIDFLDDDALWVGIFTGTGEKVFSAGVDIKDYLMKDLQQANVARYANATVRETSEGNVVIITSNGEEVRAADTVVLACGSTADNELFSKLQGSPSHMKVVCAGDACGVSNALEAILEGYKAGPEV
jgi:E-phenylitaconyl-CoA hydratase